MIFLQLSLLNFWVINLLRNLVFFLCHQLPPPATTSTLHSRINEVPQYKCFHLRKLFPFIRDRQSQKQETQLDALHIKIK